MSDGIQEPHRQPDPRRPQAPGTDPAPAGRPARHQPERDQPDREGSPEPLPGDARPHRRGARLRDRRPRRRAHPPAGHRPDHAVRRDRRQDLEERRRRAALRLAAQPRAHHAAQGRPDRGGQPAPRGAVQPRRPDAAGSTTTTTSRSSRPASSTSTTSTRGGPPYPLDHHVPRPAAAPRRRLRAAVRRRLRPRHPHRRAAHGRAAPVRPRDQGHRRQLPRAGQPGRSSRGGRSCSPSAATPSPRTP